MPKRSIGIDIGLHTIHAVQLARTGRRLRLEKAVMHPMRRRTDTPEEILACLVAKYGFERRAATAVTLAPQHLCHRTMDFQTALSDLQDEFPRESGQILTDRPAPPAGTSPATALLVAADRTEVQNRRAILHHARLRPDVLDSPVSALCAALTRSRPDRFGSPTLLLYLNFDRVLLAILRGGEILNTRNIPLALASEQEDKHLDADAWPLLLLEIKLTWQAAFQQDMPPDTPLVLTGPLAERTDLREKIAKELPGQVISIDPFADLVTATDVQPDSGFILAQGLALRALDPAHTCGVNFFRLITDDPAAASNQKRQRMLFMILLVSLAAIWLAGLFLRLQRLESRYDQLKQEILTTAQTVLPDISDIELALPMMIQHNKTLQSNPAGDFPAAGSPLKIFTAIAAHTPDSLGITIESLSIDPAIRLAGFCPSFSALQEWKTNLEQVPWFRSVQIQKQNKLSDRQEIQFTLLIEPAPEALE